MSTPIILTMPFVKPAIIDEEKNAPFFFVSNRCHVVAVTNNRIEVIYSFDSS